MKSLNRLLLKLILMSALLLSFHSCGKKSKSKKDTPPFVDSTDISKLEFKLDTSSSSKNIGKAIGEAFGKGIGAGLSCVFNSFTKSLTPKHSIEFSLALIEQVHSELARHNQIGYLRFWRYLSEPTRRKIQLEILSEIFQKNLQFTPSEKQLIDKSSALYFIQTFLDRYALTHKSPSAGNAFFQTRYRFLIKEGENLVRIQFSTRGLRVENKVDYEPCQGLTLSSLEFINSFEPYFTILECLNDEAKPYPLKTVFEGPLFHSYLIINQQQTQLLSAQTTRMLSTSDFQDPSLFIFEDKENETMIEIHFPENWNSRRRDQSIPALYMGSIKDYTFSNNARCRRLQ